jgi:hypothetical protein
MLATAPDFGGYHANMGTVISADTPIITQEVFVT